MIKPSPGGGIGRRKGLKPPRYVKIAYGFDSRPGHITRSFVLKNLTYEQFLEKVDYVLKSVPEKWRYGQAYFNVLSSVRKDIAESIRGSLLDPFNKDQVSKETESFVKSLW